MKLCALKKVSGILGLRKNTFTPHQTNCEQILVQCSEDDQQFLLIIEELLTNDDIQNYRQPSQSENKKPWPFISNFQRQ